ncbi:MAG: hypothetical protein AB1916_07870 [Thermodesulfobacteriota bacterium]
MTQEKDASYAKEEASYGPRETALSAEFAFAPARVFNALEQTAERQGLKVLMSSAANGLLVARPRLSLLNLGRRVAVTFSPAGQDRTLVRARYTHGLVSFEDRYARLSLLSDLFRSALLQLEAGAVARETAKRREPTPPPAETAPRAEAPAPDASPALTPPGEPDAPKPHPTLNELRAQARAEDLAHRGLPAGAPGAEEFLAEEPDGFRLPGRFKARRIFWFALGVVLAVALMALLTLSSR